MDLVRDYLDKQALDRSGQKMGRIDGIVLCLDGEHPPRLEAVEIGLLTQSRRVNYRLEVWLTWVATRLTGQGPQTFRVPWNKVSVKGNDVSLDVDRNNTPAMACENWLRRNVITRIPGA